MPLKDLSKSPSLEIVNRAWNKMAAGEKVYSLSIGEPVYDTPGEVIDAAAEAMRKGMTHYVSSLGIPEVRSAIVRKVKRKNSISCSIENTIFMSGKMAIYATYLALQAGIDDEVLVPDPGYFYTEPAILAGIRAVPYNLKEDYSLDLEDIGNRIGPRTRAIVINTPSNPTGKVYGRDELRGLLDLCRDRNIMIISDEAYEDLTYGKEHVSIGSLEDEPSTVATIFTMSKSYSMTGWRGGYIVAGREFIGKLGKFMDHAVTCFPPFIQHASAVALDSMDNRVEEFRKDLSRKREFMLRRIGEIDALEVNSVEGAFYMFPSYTAGMPSLEIANLVLEKHNVALLPGSAFGSRGEGHLRLSYSGSMEDIETAMDRLEGFFRSLA